MNEATAFAVTTQDDPEQIISQVAQNITPAAAAGLPNQPNLKRTLQRARKGAHGPALAQPRRLEDLDLPVDLRQMDDGSEFLIFDSGSATGSDRYVCFSIARANLVDVPNSNLSLATKYPDVWLAIVANDISPQISRILIFSSRKLLDALVIADDIHSDGTFDHVFGLFSQLYTIHGRVKSYLN